MPTEIVFGKPYEEALVEEVLPNQAQSYNNASQQDDFQIYVTEKAYQAMHTHVNKDPRTECAGVLVGHPFITSDGNHTFVIITEALQNETPDTSVVHVTVTAEASKKVRQQIDREYLGLKPVGWYHSHPGHGIFLSDHDKNVTRGIYNASWHVAIVIDPINKEIGFFRGSEGQKIEGYFLLPKVPMSVNLVQTYNAALTWLERGRIPNALNELQKLEVFFQKENGLDDPSYQYWKTNNGYRDVSQRINKLKHSNVAPSVSHSETTDTSPKIDEAIAQIQEQLAEMTREDKLQKGTTEQIQHQLAKLARESQQQKEELERVNIRSNLLYEKVVQLMWLFAFVVLIGLVNIMLLLGGFYFQAINTTQLTTQTLETQDKVEQLSTGIETVSGQLAKLDTLSNQIMKVDTKFTTYDEITSERLTNLMAQGEDISQTLYLMTFPPISDVITTTQNSAVVSTTEVISPANEPPPIGETVPSTNMVPVPDVIGATLVDATNTLQGLGLVVTITFVYSADVTAVPQTVITTEPVSNTQVEQESVITLTVKGE